MPSSAYQDNESDIRPLSVTFELSYQEALGFVRILRGANWMHANKILAAVEEEISRFEAYREVCYLESQIAKLREQQERAYIAARRRREG